MERRISAAMGRRLPVAIHVAIVGASALALLAPAFSSAQDAPEEWRERLERVMPEADRFTDRQGQPPVFEAYRTDSSTGRETLAGYVFLTSDLPPEQMGFNGPIEVLVGMDLRGVLTGIVVGRYDESLQSSRGDFLATDGFQEQFAGKSILDAFQVRRDVDGITGATITVDAMSRGIRNAAREIALAYRFASVSSASEAPALDPISITLGELERLSWTQMLLRGLVQQILVLNEERTVADLTLLHLRDEAVAEILIGPGMLGEVLERAGPLAGERHLVLAGVDGPSAGALNLARLSIVQAGDTVGLAPPEVLLFGQPREGKVDGQVRMLRVLLFDRVVDMTRPFTYVLDLRPGLGLFSVEYSGERRVTVETEGAGAEGAGTEEEETVLSRPFAGMSARVVALLAVLLLMAAAFATKRARLR
jgi:Na+-translocating ferredoxin:NAD+ oxidoreductase RnfG subunit